MRSLIPALHPPVVAAPLRRLRALMAKLDYISASSPADIAALECLIDLILTRLQNAHERKT